MDILVLGGAGQVGTELQAHAWPDGVRVHAPTREALDITDPAAVASALAERDYAAVINTAAYTAVDKAESDAVAAWRLNALAPAILAAETKARGIPLVHVSTDYVFAGTKPEGAYAPTSRSIRKASTVRARRRASSRCAPAIPATRSCARPGWSARTGATS